MRRPESATLDCPRCRAPMVDGIETSARIVHTESRCADMLAWELERANSRLTLLETLLVNSLPYLEVAQERIGEGSIIEFLVSEIKNALPKPEEVE